MKCEVYHYHIQQQLLLIVALLLAVIIGVNGHRDCGTANPDEKGHAHAHRAERLLFGKTVKYVQYIIMV